MHELTWLGAVILTAVALGLALLAVAQARWRQPLPWAVVIIAAVMLARLLPNG